VLLYVFFFFFFQAEDGIRDRTVTGVQTCALPIFEAERRALEPHDGAAVDLGEEGFGGLPQQFGRDGALRDGHEGGVRHVLRQLRSEERRVGKECRCRWSGDREKKKKKGRWIREHK